MTETIPHIRLRHTQPRDFAGIADLCRRIYPDTPPWTPEQLHSHLRVFPEGQFVAVMGPAERVVGMTASCIVLAVVPDYLSDDPETLGYAAVIEWLNPQAIRPEHYAERPTQFLPQVVAAQASSGPTAGSAARGTGNSRGRDGVESSRCGVVVEGDT